MDVTMTPDDRWLGALADAWDFGYACGLGDYGKSDDETCAANPYRTDRPTPADPAACELPGRETSETTGESVA